MASFGQPTINDVALRAGVSNMTVSRVVTGKGYVSEATRRRVLEIIDKIKYRPNALAKSMRTNSTQNIGFMLPDLSDCANSIIAQAAGEIFVKHRFRLVVASTGFSPEVESQFFSNFQKTTVDGVIAIIADDTRSKTHEFVRTSRVPIVIIDQEVPFEIDTVYSDDSQAIHQVVRHLSRLDHNRIALLTTPFTMRVGRLRYKAFQSALAEAGIEFDPSLVRLRHQVAQNGYQATLELLRLSPRPTALIVAANQLTLGSLQAIRECGLRIPEDISLVGLDEGYATRVVDPPLTVISRDMQLFGSHAATIILRRIGDPSQPSLSVTIDAQVKLGRSCARPQ